MQNDWATSDGVVLRVFSQVSDVTCPRPLLSRLPQATFLFSVVNWSPLKLGKGLVAPAWATALGWLLALSSVSLLPIWAIYALATTPGTLQQVATR